LARLIGDRRRECTALTNLGAVAFGLNDFAQARGRLEEALALARADGDSRTVAAQLINLGDVANAEGDYEAGARLAEEALEVARPTGNASIVATAATNLTTARLHLDRFDEAAESSREALRNSVEVGDETQTVICLLIMAALAEARAEAKTAARLLGFTDSFFAEHDLSLEPAERVLHADTVAALQESLGDAYEDLRREGAELSFGDALALARALD
jgi:tetratricopeptide (TPR) repeat protein